MTCERKEKYQPNYYYNCQSIYKSINREIKEQCDFCLTDECCILSLPHVVVLFLLLQIIMIMNQQMKKTEII